MSSMTVTMTTTKRAMLKFDQCEKRKVVSLFSGAASHQPTRSNSVFFNKLLLCYRGNVLYDRKLSPCWRTALVTTGS